MTQISYEEFFKDYLISDAEWAKYSARDKAFFGGQRPMVTPKNPQESKEQLTRVFQWNLMGFKKTGVILDFKWSAFPDSCEACKAMDGKIIPTSEAGVGKTLPPLASCSNTEFGYCRCGFVPNQTADLGVGIEHSSPKKFHFIPIPHRVNKSSKGRGLNLSHSMNKAPKIIKETKCTCNACGKVWHYGKQEQVHATGAALSNCGKGMMCCGGCVPALLIPDKKVLNLNKCPECGSKNIKKEQVQYEVNG